MSREGPNPLLGCLVVKSSASVQLLGRERLGVELCCASMGGLANQATVSEAVRFIDLNDEVASEVLNLFGVEVVHNSGALAKIMNFKIFFYEGVNIHFHGVGGVN